MIIGNQRNKELNIELPQSDIVVDPNKVIVKDFIFDNLKGISKKYTDELDRQAKEYAESAVKGEFASDEEIYEKAKESLDYLYGEKKSKTTAQKEQSVADLTQQKQSKTAEKKNALSELDDKYARSTDRLIEKMSRNGLLHSSILENSLEEQTRSKSAEAQALEQGYKNKINAIDQKISRLNASYEDALKNYEISYALELEDKIGKLKTQRDKAVSAFEKTNASEKEQAYDAFLQEEEARNRAYEESMGDYTDSKRQNYQERYDYVVGALAGKDKTAVSRFIKENEKKLKEYLGLYYEKFVEEVS